MYCATTATQVGLRSPFTVWVIGWAEVGLGPGCLRTPGQGHAASCCLSVRQGPGGGAVRAVQTVNMSSQVCVDSVPGDEGKPWHASSKQYASTREPMPKINCNSVRDFAAPPDGHMNPSGRVPVPGGCPISTRTESQAGCFGMAVTGRNKPETALFNGNPDTDVQAPVPLDGQQTLSRVCLGSPVRNKTPLSVGRRFRGRVANNGSARPQTP